MLVVLAVDRLHFGHGYPFLFLARRNAYMQVQVVFVLDICIREGLLTSHFARRDLVFQILKIDISQGRVSGSRRITSLILAGVEGLPSLCPLVPQLSDQLLTLSNPQRIVAFMSPDYDPSRAQVQTVPCPSCGAEKGENCKVWRRQKRIWRDRVSNHQDRVRLYLSRK